MDILITGGNGFLGSHLLVHLLKERSDVRIACLIRATDRSIAERRLADALSVAIQDANASLELRQIMSRISVVAGDLNEPGWIQGREFRGWLNASEPLHIFHSAANISFSKDDHTSVWKSNVEGTRSLLAVCSNISNLTCFNHVSTAYVAGNRDGLIVEDDRTRPPGFHNTYEESKWTAEQDVWRFRDERGIAVRIFRPSIIIGDSTTHQVSSYTGFYSVLEKMWHITRFAKPEDFPIRLPFDVAATLDLMPIDIVVKEILFLMDQGRATMSKTFHITSETPLGLPDIIRALSLLTGVPASTQPAEKKASGLGSLIARALRHYAPYLAQTRKFDRANIHQFGAGRFQQQYCLDTAELQAFAAAFLKKKHGFSEARNVR